jgi:hypothetical protein
MRGQRARLSLFAAAMLLLLVTPAAARDSDPLTRIRQLYLAAVQKESAIVQGLETIDGLRAAGIGGSDVDAVLMAYRGSLVTLRAKHAVWPPTRLRHLRDGLDILDDVVARYPENAEVRYLRLMSCYYLPGILGRGWSVREDFEALARLLPAARHGYPPELYHAIVTFVRENGDLAPELRESLDATSTGR